jgi:hypothetical protein
MQFGTKEGRALLIGRKIVSHFAQNRNQRAWAGALRRQTSLRFDVFQKFSIAAA